MIIVSQDKDVIVNFDIITKLWIQNPLENDDGEFAIIAENEWLSERLGFYKTEERAKEVLQDIADTYSKIGITFDTYNGGQVQQLPIYEIPED